jgi:superfamily II DNA or RNA helicase
MLPADSYQRVLDALSPRFLLGLTATPFRSDQRDLLALCHGNLAYQVGLLEAIGFGWLVPFRYHGIADVVVYTDDLLTARRVYDTTRLTLRFNTPERADLALHHYRQHAGRAALGLCVSIDHADFMVRRFQEAGVAAAAVHSGAASMDRALALE